MKFPYWLHAHSHLMFLGWIFNLLSLAFIHAHIEEHYRKKYITLFLIIQVLLLGMFISFPLQGYGFYSITISALHTVLVGVFTVWFFKETRNKVADPTLWFARISLALFLVSAIGPFSLGPLMVNGLVYSKWYYFAVYYYLHFQYNGVFTFGVLSLFFGLLEDRGVVPDQRLVKRFGYFLLLSCFPAYFLSTLWAQPGLIFNILGLIAAFTQLIALYYFIQLVRSIPLLLIRRVSLAAKLLFAVAFLSFITKLILQILSAHPYMAQLAYEIRNYVMAYLHLVLLGMISTLLLGWCIEQHWVKKPSLPTVILFLIGFVGTELTLISHISSEGSLINSPNLLFFFSCIMVFSLGSILWNTFKGRSI